MAPPLRDCPVSANPRKGRRFTPQGWIVGAAGGQPAGPVKVAESNTRRISLWFKAPAGNTAIVYLGDAGVLATRSAPGAAPAFSNSWELEPGESVIVDDTTGEVWAVTEQGLAGQVLKVIEQVDAG